MLANAFRVYAKHYDRIYLKKGDYRKEARVIKILYRTLRREDQRRLVVGCDCLPRSIYRPEIRGHNFWWLS